MKVPKYPWCSSVQNLYDLACFYDKGTVSDSQSYRKKRVEELHAIMKRGNDELAGDMSSLGHLLNDLFSAGSTQVFINKTNKDKYDESLKREKLKEFFALLKAAPDEFKKDPLFADSCIRNIQKSFPDYDEALALYNREAGLGRDPYEPIEALIHVTCATCKTPASFRTREEAEKGRCSVCGASFYTECPQCHNKVPANADRCTCGFRLSEMQFFEEYLRDAETAFNELDLTEAKRKLADAENAYPGNKKIAPLKARIEREAEKYQESLDKLQVLMSAGKYCEAQKMIGSLLGSAPKLKLNDKQKIIESKINEAKRKMPAASLSATDRGNACLEVLQIVADYQPAIDALAVLKLGTPTDLCYSFTQKERLSCTLTWHSAGDKGVAYSVVRKESGIPGNHTDGILLASDLHELELRDSDVQPGIRYGYAVFAVRKGVYSEAAVCDTVFFGEINKESLNAKAENGECHFSWNLPQNCIGVRILRSVGTIPAEKPDARCTIIAQQAMSGYDDTNVTNGTLYGYRLQCKYSYGEDVCYSKGVTISLTPELPPIAVENVVASVEERKVTVRWTIPDVVNCSVRIQSVSPEIDPKLIGQVFSVSELSAILGDGRNYTTVSGNARQAQFMIPDHTACTLAVLSLAGSSMILCALVPVSNIEKCEIDKRETRIENDRLRVQIANRPSYLERIFYRIAEKTGKNAPWATIDDAKQNRMQSVTLEQYDKDGMIVLNHLPKTDLYLSVIGQYKMKDGSLVYAEPSKQRICNRPKTKITYSLSWEREWGLFWKGRAKAQNCSLRVRSDTGEFPELIVAYRADSHIPMKLRDPQIVILEKIQLSEEKDHYENGVYSHVFSDDIWKRIPAGTAIRLFLNEEDMLEYELSIGDINSLNVP